jgi:hypothetical protein
MLEPASERYPTIRPSFLAYRVGRHAFGQGARSPGPSQVVGLKQDFTTSGALDFQE